MFGVGQLYQPEADRDRRRARRLRRPLARRRACRARDEGDRARDDGRPVLRPRPLRPPAGDRLRLDHAFARGGGRGRDDQHGPVAGGRRAGGPLGQVLPQGRAGDERRQPRRPVRPDPAGRVRRQGQRRDVRRHPDRDGLGDRLRGRDRRDPRRRPPLRRPGRHQPGHGRPRRLREPQVPRRHRADRPGLRRGRQALGDRPARARVRRADARLGLPDVRPRLRHPRRPRRHPGDEDSRIRSFFGEPG